MNQTGSRSLCRFVEQSPSAVAMFDRNMCYLAASDQWKSDYKLCGDLVGRCHYDVFPEISEAWKSAHRFGMAGDTVSHPADAVVRADGAVQHLEWVVWPWARSGEGDGGVIIFSAQTEALHTSEPPPTLNPAATEEKLNFNRELCRKNGMLNLLPDRLLNLLAAALTPITIKTGDVLIDAVSPLKSVLFPLGGLYSIVGAMQDGSSYEISCSGRSCRGGMSALFNDTAIEAETIAVIGGPALSMAPAKFREIVAGDAEIRAWMDRLIVATGLRMERSIGCNVRHTAEQRLARWLLNAYDDTLLLTLNVSQDDVANLLGVRRAGINESLAAMREKGLVETGRGRITITNRLGLIAIACECYREDLAARADFFGESAVLTDAASTDS